MTKKQADDLWSKAVKILAHNRCEWCLKIGIALNSHHFFSRRFLGTRYKPSCGFALCISCHFKAHQRSSEFSDWARSKRGEAWYNILRAQSYKIKADTSLDILLCKKIVNESLKTG